MSKHLEPGNYNRIARASGLSPQHVSRVCRGRRGATLRTAARIARAAGVSIDVLWQHIQEKETEAGIEHPVSTRSRSRGGLRASSGQRAAE